MQTKLKLDLEDLTVDSFDTTRPAQTQGTVFGEQLCTCGATCTCPGYPSCYNTCDETCGESCDSACGPRPTKDETCPYTCGTNSYCADCMG